MRNHETYRALTASIARGARLSTTPQLRRYALAYAHAQSYTHSDPQRCRTEILIRRVCKLEIARRGETLLGDDRGALQNFM